MRTYIKTLSTDYLLATFIITIIIIDLNLNVIENLLKNRKWEKVCRNLAETLPEPYSNKSKASDRNARIIQINVEGLSASEADILGKSFNYGILTNQETEMNNSRFSFSELY